MFENDTDTFLNSLLRFGWNLGLDRIESVLRDIGDPERKFRAIHVAGTNGKGSTCAMIAAILQAAGYKTGLYTSPHLLTVRERIRIDGVAVSETDLHQLIIALREKIAAAQCTYFEALTVLAFQYFAAEKVDIAVIETGLGGRFDATNVVDPIISIITEIDFDHEAQLGKTVRQIAKEKAGIIKPGKPCLAATRKKAASSVVQQTCARLHSAFYHLDSIAEISDVHVSDSGTSFSLSVPSRQFVSLSLPLLGSFQTRNAATAVAAIGLCSGTEIAISNGHIKDGLASVTCPGRVQILSREPVVLVDVAHNLAAIRVLFADLETIFPAGRRFVVVGLLNDKNYQAIAKVIANHADRIFVCTPDSDRALPGLELKKVFSKLDVNAEYLADLSRSFIRKVMAQTVEDDIVCVVGSHYLAGVFMKNHSGKFGKKT